MGFLAFGIVLVLALIVGFGVQMFERKPLRYEWLMIALAGAFGAYFGSETVVGSTVPILDGIKDWGPQLDGMFVIPAAVTAVILAIVMYFGLRTSDYGQTV